MTPHGGFFMEVIFLTTLFSVLFAVLFLLLFLRVRQNGDSCADQDALLPFLDEEPARATGSNAAGESSVRNENSSSLTDTNHTTSQDDQ